MSGRFGNNKLIRISVNVNVTISEIITENMKILLNDRLADVGLNLLFLCFLFFAMTKSLAQI